MLTFKIIESKGCIKLCEWTLNSERGRLHDHFTKKSKDGDFNVLVERGIWDGMDHFLSKDNEIPMGLWRELIVFSKKTGIEYNIEGINETMNLGLPREKYTTFVEELLDEIVDEFGNQIIPRDYQLEGAYRALKYKYCTQELATSAGKTLIFYIYCSFLNKANVINRHNKALLIVPNISLVNQTEEKFRLYNNGSVEWNILKIGGKNKFDVEQFKESNLVISTYQSLINFEEKCLDSQLTTAIKNRAKVEKKKNNEKELEKATNKINSLKEKIKYSKDFRMFEYFSVVNIDETHKSRGSSISNMISACVNWKYKLGLSGTAKVSEEYSDYYKIQEKVGPLVMTLSAKYLMDEGHSPNVLIKMIKLKYNENDKAASKYIEMRKNSDEIKKMFKSNKDYGREMLSIEKGIVFDSIDRLNFIDSLARKFDGNSLILFSDIKNEYGKKICKKLNEWNEYTFYIDGSVESEDREQYKDAMEKNDGVIIVASFGTFSTGIDLKNVHHIVFVETTKAEITIRQSIGRGMRKLPGKNKVVIWDLIDCLDGYSLKHSIVREKIYIDQSFDIKKHEVNL